MRPGDRGADPLVTEGQDVTGGDPLGDRLGQPGGKAKSGGATPTTLCGTRFSRIFRPAMSGSAAKRLRHSAWLIMIGRSGSCGAAS